jgi:hypothetical protein
MNSRHTRTAPPLCTMENKTTRPDTSTPSRQWNMPTELSNGRKKLLESPWGQLKSNKDRWTEGGQASYETYKPKLFSIWWFHFRSQSGRHGFKLSEKAKRLQTGDAYTLFYIQEGGVRLTTQSKHQPSAVTAILSVGDFFGELCLAGYPLRMSTAVALTASSIRAIKKEKMLQILRKRNKTSNSWWRICCLASRTTRITLRIC